MERSTSIAIYTGVFSSLLVLYLIDPIIRVFGNVVIFSYGYVNANLWDAIYTKAALGVPKDPAMILFSLLSGVMVGAGAGLVTIMYERESAQNKKLDSSESGNTAADIEQIKSKISKLRSSIRLLRYLQIGLVLFFSIFIFFQTWQLFVQHQIVTSFDQHMKILTPYMSSEQKAQIISKFSLMKSEDDYLKIYEGLNSIAKANDIILPENPSYSMWSM
jgi:hypothetical protein